VLSSGRRSGSTKPIQNNSGVPQGLAACLWQAEFGDVRPLGGGRMFDLRRREFITLLGGAAAACPLAARAQQPGMPVVALLSARVLEIDAPLVGFIRQGLTQSGYVEGQNVAIEYRGAAGDYGRLPDLARN
jgi:hypothetical protein